MKILSLMLAFGVATALLSCRQETSDPRAEALCVLCEKPIPEGKDVIPVTADGQSQPYCCIHCALTAPAAAPPPSTVTVHAPLSNTAITIRRGETGWSVNPAAVPNTIEGALSDAGNSVGARFVDASRPEGKAILSAHGIHQHLPVVMFLDGSSRLDWEGRNVELRGFPGKGWSREALAAVLRQEAARTQRSKKEED